MNKPLQPSNKWTSNITEKQLKEEFNKRLLESKDLFQRLAELVEVKVRSNAKKRIADSSYEKPAWSESQADANGYERALTDVLEYLKFTKE